ncbi:nuclear transport factor 2 family protein [Plantactinospora siamensis]|uniref:Nuclear transport factor 2 family protein n=1 Tax=Plantactinospora siamensis TaxID=555372 RepID=A0ABV6NUF9_9ACTN
MRAALPRARTDWAAGGDTDRRQRELLRRYVDAHRAGDHDALTALLREDLRVSFPPLPLWVDGRAAYQEESRRFADPGDYRIVAVGANRQPAVAVLLRRPDHSPFRLHAVEVLRIEADRVAEIVARQMSGST